MKKQLLFCLLFSLSVFLSAQNDFYNIDTVQEIKIYFEEPNWSDILNDLFVAGDKERLMGTVEINGTRIDSVGIRYKGFSSASTTRKKNPFNIKLDFVKEQ